MNCLSKKSISFNLNFSLHAYFNIVFLVNKALAESVFVKSSLLIRYIMKNILEVKFKKLKNNKYKNYKIEKFNNINQLN